MGGKGSGDIPGAGARPEAAPWERQAAARGPPPNPTPRGQQEPSPCPGSGHTEPGQGFRKETRLLFKVKVTQPLLPSSPAEHPRFISSS